MSRSDYEVYNANQTAQSFLASSLKKMIAQIYEKCVVLVIEERCKMAERSGRLGESQPSEGKAYGGLLFQNVQHFNMSRNTVRLLSSRF